MITAIEANNKSYDNSLTFSDDMGKIEKCIKSATNMGSFIVEVDISYIDTFDDKENTAYYNAIVYELVKNGYEVRYRRFDNFKGAIYYISWSNPKMANLTI